MTFFQIKSHFDVLGVRTSMFFVCLFGLVLFFLEGTVQPIALIYWVGYKSYQNGQFVRWSLKIRMLTLLGRSEETGLLNVLAEQRNCRPEINSWLSAMNLLSFFHSKHLLLIMPLWCLHLSNILKLSSFPFLTLSTLLTQAEQNFILPGLSG